MTLTKEKVEVENVLVKFVVKDKDRFLHLKSGMYTRPKITPTTQGYLFSFPMNWPAGDALEFTVPYKNLVIDEKNWVSCLAEHYTSDWLTVHTEYGVVDFTITTDKGVYFIATNEPSDGEVPLDDYVTSLIYGCDFKVSMTHLGMYITKQGEDRMFCKFERPFDSGERFEFYPPKSNIAYLKRLSNRLTSDSTSPLQSRYCEDFRWIESKEKDVIFTLGEQPHIPLIRAVEQLNIKLQDLSPFGGKLETILNQFALSKHTPHDLDCMHQRLFRMLEAQIKFRKFVSDIHGI